MQIITKSIDEVKPYSKNPRKNDDAVKYVKQSIKQFGFKVPLVIDKKGVIVTGHTRYKAAIELGYTELPCVVADDLSPEQVKAFRLADNKVSEMAEWDFDLLGEELADIFDFDMSDFGFDLEEDEETPKEREDLSEKVGETYEVIVECESELQQEEIFYKLTKEGLQCRTLTL